MSMFRHPRENGRRGAALVVALGVLSLVMLLVAAFVLSMRAERQVARNVRAKENSREYASVASYLAGCYYLPIPEDARPEDETYFIPRVDWLDQTGEDAADGEAGSGEISEDGESTVRKAYGSSASLQEYGSVFRDGIAALSGTEIGGQEAVFLGDDEATRFATLPGSVTNFLPHLYVEALETNALPLRWQFVNCTNVGDGDGGEEGADVRLAMRVAFFLADLSGQADVNHLTTNQWRMAGFADPAEAMDAVSRVGPLANRPDVLSFLDERYGDAVPAEVLDALGAHSLDPDPNQIPYGAPIGSPDLLTTNKFDLCAITNGTQGAELLEEDLDESDDPRWRWQDAADRDDDVRDYLQALSNALFRVEPFELTRHSASNEIARAVFWNLLNDLDADRYPQTDSAAPWLDEYGVEALPLLSELCVTNATAEGDAELDLDFDDFGFVDDCPACRALKASLQSQARERSYRASAEVWYPFACTNELPESVWLAMHLYKTTYTNDVDSIAERIEDNLGNVTEIVEAHWGTNVVRTAYRHSRDTTILVPSFQVQTLEFGGYPGGEDGGSDLYLSAGVKPEPPPASLDEQVQMGGVTVTNDAVVTISTNGNGRLMVVMTVESGEEPAHLYDSLLDGPMGSLLAGEAAMEYSVSSNLVSEADGDDGDLGDEGGLGDDEDLGDEGGVGEVGGEEDEGEIGDEEPPAEPEYELLYTTTFTFVPDDQAGLVELLRSLLQPEEPEEESGEEGGEEDEEADSGDGETPEETAPEEVPETEPEEPSGEAPEPGEPPAGEPSDEEPPPEGEPEEEPEEEAPSSLTLPVVSTALYNDLGEVVTVLTSTPENKWLRKAVPYLSRFIRQDVADRPGKETTDATRLSYNVTVHYTVRKIGPESQHGSKGLTRIAADALVADITPEPFEIEREELEDDRFACVTNDVFHFDVPVEHIVWDTNGMEIARHTVSNLLPIGQSAYTNVFYRLKPEAEREYAAADGGKWVAGFDASDFIETNAEQRVENSLFLSAQLFLDEPEIKSLLAVDEADDVDDETPAEDSGTVLDLSEAPYDEGPGPGSDDARDVDDQEGAEPWLLELDRAFSMEVDDPRFNGRTHEWNFSERTPGELPRRFPGRDEEEAFWTEHPKFAGYPILHRDGLPDAVGDIGYLGTCEPWETVDLLSAGGAKLLDLWCVGAPDGTNATRRAYGRIHAQTPFPMAAAMLFADTLFGTNRLDREWAAENGIRDFCDLVDSDDGVLEVLTNAMCAVAGGFHPAATNSLQLLELDGFTAESGQDEALEHAVFPFAQWMSALAPELLKASADGEGAATADIENWRESALAKALDAMAEDADEAYACEVPGLDRLEDLVRDLPDRVTFRQNLVLMVSRSDALAPNGRVQATTRFATLLHRDSWTGRWFVLDQVELK